MDFLDFLGFLFSRGDGDYGCGHGYGFPLNRQNIPKDPALEQIDFFYPNACQVCGCLGQLLRCAKCQMVSYCGKQHQTEHWRLHKYLCSKLADLRKRDGFLRKAKDRKLETWTNAKIACINSISSKLGRFLTPYERKVIQFTRSCCICHDIEQGSLINCPNCASVSICHVHKNRFHQVHTQEKCANFKLCYQFDRDQFHATRDEAKKKKKKNEKKKAKPKKYYDDTDDDDSDYSDVDDDYDDDDDDDSGDSDSENSSESEKESTVIITEIKPAPMNLVPYFENLPDSTLKFVEILSTRPVSLENVKLKDFEMCDLFLKPLCVFRVLQLLDDLKKADVTIHLLGAQNRDLETCDFWEILFHLIPELKTLRIVNVHPEFSKQSLQPNLCTKCTDSEKNLIFEKKPFTYEDFCMDKSFSVPNLVIGFLTSLKSETNVLKMIASHKTLPLALTNNCQKLAQENHKIVEKLFGKSAKHRLYERNPFCGLKPSLDFKTDGFYYEHNFLTIFKSFDELEAKKRKNNGVRK